MTQPYSNNVDYIFYNISDEQFIRILMRVTTSVVNTYFDKKISLDKEEKNCVLGRSVVIHADEDDMGKGLYVEEDKNAQTLVTGNAGDRLACAEIRIIKDPNF